jgi:hypothetical protein
VSSYSEQLDFEASAFRPDQGGPQKLIGQVVDIDVRGSDYGDDYTVVTVKDEETGECFAWHAFHQTARDAVARLNPQVGDTVGVKYLGKSDKHKPGQHPAVIWRFKIFEVGAYGEAVRAAKIAELSGGVIAAGNKAVVESGGVPLSAADAGAAAAAAAAGAKTMAEAEAAVHGEVVPVPEPSF